MMLQITGTIRDVVLQLQNYESKIQLYEHAIGIPLLP